MREFLGIPGVGQDDNRLEGGAQLVLRPAEIPLGNAGRFGVEREDPRPNWATRKFCVLYSVNCM